MNTSKTIALLVGLLVASVAQGAYLYSWSATPTLSDPVDGSFPGGRDITPGVWVASDASYWYFRMDLREAPTALGNNYAGLYGFYIDSIDGAGANGGDLDYIPSALAGVDIIVDSHFNNSGTGGWESDHFHYNWNGAGFAIAPMAQTQQTENGGKTLEWKVDKAAIGEEFFFWAATHDVGSSAPSYDVVPAFGPGFYVPEPATIGVLLAGSVAALRRRRR